MTHASTTTPRAAPDHALNSTSLINTCPLRIAAALGAILLLTAAVYWPGLAGDLVLDDSVTLEPIARLAEGELGWREALLRHDNFRPLSMASFVANWLTTGDRVWPMKLTNLLLHLATGVLVFLIALELLARPVAAVRRARHWLALWIAACWLLAPLLVSTVLYITQRMAILSAFFALAALLVYLHGRVRIADRQRGGAARVVLALAVLWPLSILAKENGVLVPVLIVVVELFFFTPENRQPGAAADAGPRARLIGVFLAAALLVGGVLLATAPPEIFLSYAYRPFTPFERVLTEWRILFDYAANLLMVPGASPFGIYHDDYPVSRGLLEPPSTLLAGLAWLGIVAAGWLARGTRAGVLLFGAWFFLAGHLAESTILPLELYFEHRNYLPSVGIYFSLGYAAYLLLERVGRVWLLAVAFSLVPVAFGAVTYHRVLVWQSWERMLLAAVSHYPDSLRVQTGLANLHADRGELGDALANLQRAAARPDAPRLGLALHVLAVHCISGRPVPTDAYTRLAQAPAQDDFYTLNALAWLADSVERNACPMLERRRIAAALDSVLEGADAPGRHGKMWLVHVHTARLLAAAGRTRDALAHLERATHLRPGRLEPRLLALGLRLDLGELAEARRTLGELEALEDGHNASRARLIEPYRQRLETLEAQRR